MTMKIQTLTKEEQRLISFLPAGAERPRSQSELAALLYGNASNENKRKVRKLVNQSILDGAPVGSLHRSYNAGYFLITNEDERLAALIDTQGEPMTKADAAFWYAYLNVVIFAVFGLYGVAAFNICELYRYGRRCFKESNSNSED